MLGEQIHLKSKTNNRSQTFCATPDHYQKPPHLGCNKHSNNKWMVEKIITALTLE
jgi:hypothetical protein